MAGSEKVTITEDEAALYDRQIRLWGLDAQRRLRAARVLLVGVGGLGAEVAKNIVLSGINSLTLLDHRPVAEEDACCQFLVDRSDTGKNRAAQSLERTQQLNPMVTVTADTDDVAEKQEEFFTKFDVVCATCCSEEQLLQINDVCHKNNIMFFAGDVFGFYGYMFTDLNEHEYAEEITERKAPTELDEPAAKKAKMEEVEAKVVKKMCAFKRLKDALAVNWATDDMKKKIKRTPSTFFVLRVLWEFMLNNKRKPSTKQLKPDRESLEQLRETVATKLGLETTVIPDTFHLHCFAELSAVCAVVGGVLGQEVIKAVSQKDPPHNNFFFFDGVEGSGMVDNIG